LFPGRYLHAGEYAMRPSALTVILGFCFLILCGDAFAANRVALIIGNSAYQRVPMLANPENDADSMSILFKRMGFDVVQLQKDVGINDMRRVIRDFSETAREADIAVIYYAGHGIEVGGLNYLIPVDAALRRDIDVEDETVSLDRLLQVMEPARQLRLVILDACRENPFATSMRRTMVSRSIGRGLARVEPTTSNTLIAFAAKAGSTAADGTGTDSPFTSALLKHLETPGLDVRLAFGRVRDEVLKSTTGGQEPFVYGSLGGATVTLSSLTSDERPTVPNADPDAATSRDYEATAKVGTREAWESFLQKYPNGLYADLARAQLSKLQKERQKPSSAADQPKSTKEPKGRSKGEPRTTGAGGAVYQRCMAQYASQANGDTTYFWKRARMVCAAVARNPSPGCVAGGHC
jgi:uncharacterized caspase-like protein